METNQWVEEDCFGKGSLNINVITEKLYLHSFPLVSSRKHFRLWTEMGWGRAESDGKFRQASIRSQKGKIENPFFPSRAHLNDSDRYDGQFYMKI